LPAGIRGLRRVVPTVLTNCHGVISFAAAGAGDRG
jgi:hypothetical protein